MYKKNPPENLPRGSCRPFSPVFGRRRYVQFWTNWGFAVVVEWSQIKLRFELGPTVTEISTIEKFVFCLNNKFPGRITRFQGYLTQKFGPEPALNLRRAPFARFKTHLDHFKRPVFYGSNLSQIKK